MKKQLISTIFLTVSMAAFCQPNSKVFSAKGKEVKIYTTAENTKLRLSETGTAVFTASKQPLETEPSIFVNPKKQFQTFMGIGGAITDASAEVYAKLPKDQQKEFIDAYYSPQKGIGYSLIRTTIHSSDFSSASYTYVDENDKELKTFNIDHDRKFRIPLIKEALKTADKQTQLYASPWSPPAFMKDSKSMLKGGKLAPDSYQSWANYYVKFIQAYEKEGLPIWGVTVQNEPMATQSWESCIFTAEEERDFLKKYLGPTLQKNGLGSKKIVIWDHNRDLMVYRANVIYADPEASKYAWGMGFHWYETWNGGKPMFENVKLVNESFPDKKLMFTEGCIEAFDANKYQLWANAERYGNNMINDFNNGTVAWTDWNILLDEKGGPNHVKNFCFAPIHGDLTTGKLIYTPSYYYIGHFSKYIRPEAKRIATSASRSQLQSTSFLNKDGKMVTVVMNQSDGELKYNLIVDDAETVLTIPAHAMQTLVY